jgi:hypothetical protein
VSDLKDTLMHEMIHAYLFLTLNEMDHEAHGPAFVRQMERLNREAGRKITIYHSFSDEVSYYQTHVWRYGSHVALGNFNLFCSWHDIIVIFIMPSTVCLAVAVV